MKTKMMVDQDAVDHHQNQSFNVAILDDLVQCGCFLGAWMASLLRGLPLFKSRSRQRS